MIRMPLGTTALNFAILLKKKSVHNSEIRVLKEK
jgi:hypothetical protein